MNNTDIQIPPPKDWQAFERLCADLWESIWNDPNTQRNGRLGQKQHGIDIYGRVDGAGPYQGVQCKGKNAAYGKNITKDELREEVEKAKKFKPSIKNFILATTAPNDAEIQRVAREITVEHESTGYFSVTVCAWDEIERKLAAYPGILQRYYPGLAYNSKDLTGSIEELNTNTKDIKNITQQTLELFIQRFPQVTESIRGEEPNAAEAKLNAKIDSYSARIKTDPKAALVLFEDLYASNEEVSPQARYRMLANIGVARLELDDQGKASEFFIEAGELIPEEARGMSRVALGYLLRDKPAEARKFAEKAIDIDPMHDQGYAALIGALSQEGDLEGIEEFIPEGMLANSNIMFNLGQAFLRKGEPAKAVEWSKKAYDAEPESRECKVAYGAALLAQACFDLRDNSGEIPPPIRASLENARDYMEEVWQEVYDSDRSKRFAYAATNLARIHQLLENPQRANEILQKILQICPGLLVARKLAAGLCFQRGDADGGFKHLSQVPAGVDIQADLMRVEALAGLGRQAEALSALDELELSADKERDSSTAKVFRIRITEDLQDPQAALELVEIELDKDPQNTSIWVEKANILKRLNEENAAKEAIFYALETITDSTYPYDILSVANTLQYFEMYTDAAKTYARVVQFTSDTQPLRNYLACLYYAEQRETFSKAIEGLSEEIASLGFYKKIIAYHHLQTGELDSARRLFEDYLETIEDTLPVRLAWLQVLQRQMDEDTLVEYCSASPEYPDASPRDTMHFVYIIVRYGSHNHALKVAYKVSRMNPRDIDALRGYCLLSISEKFTDANFTTYLRVEPDASFTLEDDSGETRNYTIEANWTEALDGDQILPNHPIAREAIGKKVGESFTIKGMVQETTWTITKIVSKYLKWYQEASENISKYFPVGSGFELVNVRRQEGDGEYDFSTILKSLDQRRESFEKAVELYVTDPMPVALLASTISVDALDAWIDLRNSTEIICCDGTETEHKEALKIIDGDHSYIIDPLTLYTLFALGVHNIIKSTLKDLAIVQSSLDVFTAKIATLQHARSYGYMVSVGDGTYAWNKIKKENRESTLTFYKQILDWIQMNCKIIPAVGDAPNFEGWETVKENIEPWFIDSLIAAKGAGRVLFSEDHRYRIYAKQLFGVDGIWIQVALGKAVEKVVISVEQYSLALGDLLLANHAVVRISSYDLICMLESSTWEESERFKAAVKSLQRESLDVRSVLIVTAQFIYDLWVLRNNYRIECTNMILNTFFKSRHAVIKYIFMYLVQMAKYLQLPVREDYLSALHTWGVGHMVFAPCNISEFMKNEKQNRKSND